MKRMWVQVPPPVSFNLRWNKCQKNEEMYILNNVESALKFIMFSKKFSKICDSCKTQKSDGKTTKYEIIYAKYNELRNI